MSQLSQPVITRAEQHPQEGWNEPGRGRLTWHTLISQGVTPSDSMSAGVAEVPPGGELCVHSHAQPEIYFILEGKGVVTLAGIESLVKAGDAVFIPGDTQHGIRSQDGSTVRFFYVFPTDRFSDVVYRFPDQLG